MVWRDAASDGWGNTEYKRFYVTLIRFVAATGLI
jgi:hypothetical protein